MFRLFFIGREYLSCQKDLSRDQAGNQQLKHNGPAIKGGCVAE